MKSVLASFRRTAGILAICAFFSQTAHADFNYGYRDRYHSDDLMPASRGTLTAADVDFGDAPAATNIPMVRAMLNSAQSFLSQQSTARNLLTATSAAATAATTLTNYFVKNAVTAAMAGDGIITRTDMINIFNTVKADNTVTASEYTDLQVLLNNPTGYKMVDYVANLARKLVFGNVWNATYKGQALGNLQGGSTGDQLAKLVDKWFYGGDLPEVHDYWTGVSYSYAAATGALFYNGARYVDITQGMVGDCWIMAAAAEVATRDANVINTMFTDNLDGTYTVRLYQNGLADYTTVNRMLPVDSYGRLVMANYGLSATAPTTEIWVPMLEKAYVQSLASWTGAANSYSSVNGGYIGSAFSAISGRTSSIGNALSVQAIESAWKNGSFVGFASKGTPASSTIVGGHAYALVAVNTITHVYTLYNPYGYLVQNPLVQVSFNMLSSNFYYFDKA